MKSFIHEIHRRSLWQVLGIYLGASWIVLQIVDTMAGALSLPDWAASLALFLLVVGFPIVLATAFVQEGLSAKEPESPPQSLADAGEVAPPEATKPTGGRRLFTWRRALVGGGAALGVLLLATGGWAVLRTLGIGPAGTLVAKGVLAERSTILLSDFRTSDPSLSRAATEALRVDLGQSAVIDVADPAFVKGALARMERDPDEPLDLETGRELAVREGMPAVIGGEITAVGTGYVLTAQVVAAETGKILASDRETANDDSELVPAIDRLSKKLRERIGESLGDLAGGPPLERVTTGNLEALRTYSRALEASDTGQNQQAADLLEEVVAQDTGFAMAWRKLGMLHVSGSGALGNFTRGVEALGRAYALRDRLTERERDLATAGYYGYVERDDRRSADAYERMLERDPNDDWALNNLALIVGSDFGDDERAEELLLRSMAIDTLSSTHHWNLSVTQARLGKYDESAATLAAWRRRVPIDPLPLLFGGSLAAASRDFDAADSLAREAVELRPGNRGDEGFSKSILGSTAAVRGRVAEATRLLKEVESIDAERGAQGSALSDALAPAWIALATLGARGDAAAQVEEALDRYPLEEMGPLDPPWGQLTILHARVVGADRARQTLAQWEAADPNATLNPAHTVAGAWISIAEGQPQEAIRRLAGVRDPECTTCAPEARAAAWASIGDADSTIVYAKEFTEVKSMFRVFTDAAVLGPHLERLAQLYDEKGDLENAASYYAQFVQLWADADAVLQPRVEAAQARLEEILSEIG